MIENIQLYSIFPLVTGIMAMVLGIALLRKSRQVANVNGFFVILALFMVTGVLDFMMINASDDGSALFFARGVFLCLVLIFASFLYISTQLTYLPLSKWFNNNHLIYYVMSLVIGLSVAMSLTSVGHNQFGYGPSKSFGTVLEVVVVTIFAIATVSLLVKRRFATDDKMVRNECVLLSLAVLIPYTWAGVLVLIRVMGFTIPSELSPGFFVSILIIGFSIYQHRLFTIVPVSEDSTGIKGAKGSALLAPGSYLLFEEAKSDGMYESFLSQVSNGVEGLIVTRTYPEPLRERFGLKRTPVIWLSSQPGHDSIDPTNLSILEHTIVEFLKVGHNTVVAIDGLEYLISNNGSTKVLRMLYGLRDEILMNESRMIVTLDPEVLDIKELAFFERDFKVVRRS